MKPTIFLDLDGVLATNIQLFDVITKDFQSLNENSWAKELKVPYPFDNVCVDVLNEILEKTEADIVLSSDWKKHWTLEQLDIIFKNNRIIKSPIDITTNKTLSYMDYEKNRAYQIEEYVKRNNIEKFVIIDDMYISHYLDDMKNNFIQTDGYEGIKEVGIKDKILNVLKS
jgi:hypothetical protein